MNDTELDNKFKAYYAEQTMSMSSVQRILEQGRAAKEERPSRWRSWVPMAIAASMALLISFQVMRPNATAASYTEEVAGAIAVRHNNFHEFNYAASSYEDVQSGLKELMFSVQPVMKQKLLSAYELIGARYCQLEGQQAAHIQVRNRKSGALCTLYIATLSGRLAELKDSDAGLDLESHHVDMWADSGRLFAIVK